MKRKNISPQPLTKADLEAVLERFATKDDLKKYATKDDLRIEIKFNTDEILTKVDENARQYRDEVLTSNDKLAKTLETIQEDIEIGNFQVKKQIKSHEERIMHLEKLQTSAV